MQLGVVFLVRFSEVCMLERGVEEGDLRKGFGFSAGWGFGWKGRAMVWGEG